jgi:hypothetical protein
MNIKRFIVENEGSYPDKVKLFFDTAFNYALDCNISNITLLVPNKAEYQDSIIAKYFEEEAYRILCKGKTLKISNGLNINLESTNKCDSSKQYGLVLGAYLGGVGLDVLNSIRHAKAIAYLPYLEDDGRKWVSIWSPVVWGENLWQVDLNELPEKLDKALCNMSRKINISTGITRISDKNRVIKLMLDMRDHRFNISVGDIERWALRNYWKPKSAWSLALLAERYMFGPV